MFHVEHLINEYFNNNNINVDQLVKLKYIDLAVRIHDTNKKFNLTGFKTVEDVLMKLILNSLDPFINWNVPRGTLIADIGTGAGVPGIPLAIFRPEVSFILFDSNNKKAEFISEIIRDMNILNAKIVCGRIEDFISVNGDYRSKFDWVISRAFAPVYAAIELELPALRVGGNMYMYSNYSQDELSDEMKKHLSLLGGSFNTSEIRSYCGININGLLFHKDRPTPDVYPRKYSVIKKKAENFLI